MNLEDLNHVVNNLKKIPDSQKITDIINNLGRNSLQWFIYFIMFIVILLILIILPALIKVDIFRYEQETRMSWMNTHTSAIKDKRMYYDKRHGGNRL